MFQHTSLNYCCSVCNIYSLKRLASIIFKRCGNVGKAWENSFGCQNILMDSDFFSRQGLWKLYIGDCIGKYNRKNCIQWYGLFVFMCHWWGKKWEITKLDWLMDEAGPVVLAVFWVLIVACDYCVDLNHWRSYIHKPFTMHCHLITIPKLFIVSIHYR